MTRYKYTKEGRVPFLPAEEIYFDSLVLPEAKKELIDLEKAKRMESANASINGFQVRNYEDRENIQGAIDYYDVLTSNGTMDLVWTMEDNTEKIVSKADLQAVKDEYVIRKATLFSTYQKKKKDTDAAKDINEVTNISNT